MDTDRRNRLKCRFRAREIVQLIHGIYFLRPKMRGNRDVEFFASINDTFICLIATAIQHCLKEWRSGTLMEDQVDFKSESAGGK